MDVTAVIETNLILIDGIAGTGKTTLARRLHRLVDDEHGNAIVYHEFDTPHPIHEWDVDDVQTWQRKTIANWSALTRTLLRTQSVGIVEGSLFQGTVGELLERDNNEDVILEYALQIPSLIQATSPILIYLVPDNIRSHIERTYGQRPGRWQTKIDHFIQQTAFGRARRLAGLEGYLTFLGTLKRLSDHLFEAYEMKKLRVNVSHGNWDDHDSLITDFLEIVRKEPH
jgi:uridine kinase